MTNATSADENMPVATTAVTSPVLDTVDSHSPLLTLSAELLCAISEMAKRKDVINLRLVCRALSAASFGTFCARFFWYQSFLMTCEGLQRLVEITSHPHLCTKLVLIQPITLRFSGTNTAAKAIWDSEQTRLTPDGAQNLLTQVFNNLAACRTQPRLLVANKHNYGDRKKLRSFTGYPIIRDLLGEQQARRHIRMTDDRASCLKMVTIASAKSTAPMTKLDIWHINGLFHDNGTFDLPKDTLQTAWSKLKSLKLPLWEIYHDWNSPNFRGLSKLLESATDLQELGVCQQSRFSNGFILLGTKFDSFALRRIELSSFHGDTTSMMRFLNKQRGTLRELILRGVGLPSEADWKHVMSALAQTFRLDVIRISVLSIQDKHFKALSILRCPSNESYRGLTPYQAYQHMKSWKGLRVKGRDEVQKALVELAEFGEVEEWPVMKASED